MPRYILTLVFLFTFLFVGFSQDIVFTESVEYDVVNQRFLLSNKDNILARDYEGNFSVFGSTSASHGMEILGNTLFALEGSVVKGIDLTTEMLVMELNIPGAIFLNGISNDGQSKIYVSDFSAQKIYEIEVGDLANPSFSTFVDNTQSTPNGLLYEKDENRLLFLTWGNNASIRAIDLEDQSMATVFSSSFGNFDGIAKDSAGRYYVSSWSPDQVFVLENDFTNPTELIIPGIDSPADIGFAKDSCVLGIPMGSKVVFFQLEKEITPTAITSTPKTGIRMGIQGNPVSELSTIYYELPTASLVELQLIDLQGKVMHQLVKRQQNAGAYLVSMAGLSIPSGIYWIALKTEKDRLSQKIIVGQ